MCMKKKEGLCEMVCIIMRLGIEYKSPPILANRFNTPVIKKAIPTHSRQNKFRQYNKYSINH